MTERESKSQVEGSGKKQITKWKEERDKYPYQQTISSRTNLGVVFGASPGTSLLFHHTRSTDCLINGELMH